MKASTPKIDTAAKLLMGGQTLNMTGLLDIRASKFRCEVADHEMRAVLDAGRAVLGTGDQSPVATLNVHPSLERGSPQLGARVTTQCLLTQISMYKSVGTEIPGLRLDYDDCPFGPAKKATLLIGLRKVRDNWGKTPGLGDFFKDACAKGSEGRRDSKLRFDHAFGTYQTAAGPGCWAQSADYTLMTSERNCFEPAMVFTLMDDQNHIPLFPVTDSEWEYLQKTIPTKPAVPAGGVTPVDAGPCAPRTPEGQPVKVYGHILQNRMCIGMPELGCDNSCGKVCKPPTVQSGTTTTAPQTCTTCYDCERSEMCYAFFCTILAFVICNTWHKHCYNGICAGRFIGTSAFESSTQRSWNSDMRMPEQPYSQISPPLKALNQKTWPGACIGMFFLSFVSTLLAFTIVNCLDYCISVHWYGEEMCLKVFDWQNHYYLSGYWNGGNDRTLTCHNKVCFFRLWGLFAAVWFSLWGLFCHWRFFLAVTVEKNVVTNNRVVAEHGGKSGIGMFAHGGDGLVACSVQ